MPVLVLLVVLATLLMWFPLLRATMPVEIAYNEGWNTYWQDAAAAGQRLYGTPPGPTIENYPPLSFHLIGLLGRIIGDTNVAGRAVALLSLGLVCGLAGRIATQVSGSRFAGWYAGLCLLVWFGAFAPDRIAMNDPQLLGMVPELLGFFIYARWSQSVVALCLSAVLFALAVFTKQNLIACPIAVGVDMLLARHWKGLCIWVAVGLATAGLLLAAAVGVDGGFFLDHLLRSRAADYAHGWGTDIGYVVLFAPAVVLCACWVTGVMGTNRSRLLAIGWIVASGCGMAFAFGHGVATNILFEAMVFSAIIVPIGYWDLLGGVAPWRPAVCASLLILSAAWIPALVPSMLVDGFHKRWDLPHMTKAFESAADLMRARSGPGWCEDLLLCHAAGKPMVYDAYFVQDQIETGRLAPCSVLRQLALQGPTTIEIGAPPDRNPPSPKARLRFTARFMRTLLTYYSPVLQTPDFTILEPSLGPWRDNDACRPVTAVSGR